MGIIDQAKAYVEANREALIDQAATLLKSWRGKEGLSGDLVYQLNDQDHFDDLWEGFLEGKSPQEAEDILMEVNSDDFGMNLDIWIEAARRLEFVAFVGILESVKADGI